MNKNILFLFAAALLFEAALITTTQYPQTAPTVPPRPETVHCPLITPQEPQTPPINAPPADQTTVFRPPGSGSTAMTAFAIAYSALAGFIMGYVNYR